jgi:DNA repair exonuclease SbcCD ATPase subunit
MSYKIINLTIPTYENIPNEVLGFSPEETYKMIKIGCECLLEGRKVVAGLTQQEIYNKIKDETKEQTKKLELDILVEREISKKMGENISKIYEGQIEQLKKQMETMRQQLKTYESENADIIQKEIDKSREKFNLLLQEKDKQNQLNRESIEKLSENVNKLTNKSTSHKGSEGEKQFNDYTETFIDFKGYQIIDKHTQSGEGDFHLHFEEFDILADAKNYKKKVPADQREKIKKDLLKNEHIHFAWLVSLNTSIDKWDKSPIMYEWVNTTQCIVYINNLSSFEDPKKILRIVWFTCKELYKLIEDVNYDETELIELKEKQFKFQDKIKDIRKSIRELNTTMNTSRSIIQSMDDQLREIIESETSKIIDSNYSLFDEWWEVNIESTNDNVTQNSTDLWTKFKQDHKNMIKELDITVDKFKQYIKSKVPFVSLIIKNLDY